MKTSKTLVAITISLVALATFAEERSSIYTLTLEQLLSVQVDVATRTSEFAREAPSSVSVYDAQEFRSMGITTLDELLNYIPGFFLVREDSNRTNTAVIRGRRINGNSPDLLVMLDGVRLNDPVTGGGLYSTPDISLVNIEQVEVIRGPGSAMYGSNAFSGVVNLISSKTDNHFNLKAGNYGRKEASGTFSHQFDQISLYGFIGVSKQSGNEYPPLINNFGLNENTYDPHLHHDIHITAATDSLKVSAKRITRDYDDFVLGGASGNGINSADRGLDIYSINYTTSINDVSVTAFGEYVDGYQDAQVLFYPAQIANQVPGGWTDGSVADLIGGNYRDVNEIRFGLDGALSPNGTHQINFGVHFRNQETGLNYFKTNIDVEKQASSNGTVITPSLTGFTQGYYLSEDIRLDLILPYDRDIYGVYLQDNWQIDESNEITVGLRYDDYEDFGNNLSLRFGWVKNLTDSQQIKVLYGEAYRPPEIIEARAEYSSVEVGNPDLKPELVKTLDVIWLKQWQDVSISTNAYFSKVNDEIVVELREIFAGFTSFQPVNKGSINLSGIEIEAQAQLSSNLMLRSGLTFAHQYQPLGAAKRLAFFSLNYSQDKWLANLSGQYRSKVLNRQINGNDYWLDDYWQLNAQFAYQYSERAQLVLDGRNLTNKTNYGFATAQNLTQGLPSLGRNISMELRYRF